MEQWPVIPPACTVTELTGKMDSWFPILFTKLHRKQHWNSSFMQKLTKFSAEIYKRREDWIDRTRSNNSTALPRYLLSSWSSNSDPVWVNCYINMIGFSEWTAKCSVLGSEMFSNWSQSNQSSAKIKCSLGCIFLYPWMAYTNNQSVEQ